MDAKQSNLYASFFLISLEETTLQLQKSMKLLEKEFERPLKIHVGMRFAMNKRLICIPSSEIYNLYKHQGAETAQYRLEIIFNVNKSTQLKLLVHDRVCNILVYSLTAILSAKILRKQQFMETQGTVSHAGFFTVTIVQLSYSIVG